MVLKNKNIGFFKIDFVGKKAIHFIAVTNDFWDNYKTLASKHDDEYQMLIDKIPNEFKEIQDSTFQATDSVFSLEEKLNKAGFFLNLDLDL